MEIWNIEHVDIDLNKYLKSKNMNKSEPRFLYKSGVGTIESCYVVGIYVDQKLMGKSGGESAAIAKRMAELDVLRNMFHLDVQEVKFEFGPKAYDLQYEKFSKENFHLIDSQNKMEHVSTSN